MSFRSNILFIALILGFYSLAAFVNGVQQGAGVQETAVYGTINPTPYLPFKPHYEFGGYVWLNTHGESRQFVFFENGNYVLYPLKKQPDAFCCDINTQPETVMTGAETQLHFSAYTDELPWCKKATGYVECDWTGINISTPGLFLMRNVYGLLEWEHARVLFGQFYHPMYAVECFPDVVSYNGGTPIESLSRTPQARATLLWGNSELMLYAGSQSLPFVSQGPIIPEIGSTPSTAYIRDAVMPNFHTQYRYVTDHVLAAGFFDVKRLVPRLVNDEGNKVHESIVSYCGGGYTNIKYNHGKVSLKAFYAQNPTDLTMIGGYAVSCVDPVFDQWSYTATQCVSAWADWEHYIGNLVFGMFAGVTKNLGTTHNLATNAAGDYTFYARDPDIDYVWRISPRVWYTAAPFRIAFELELTQAAYGTIQRNGKVTNSVPVNGVSVNISAFYYF